MQPPDADVPVRIAVLDDYQRVARSSAPWSDLPANAEVTYFHDHVAAEAAVIERLLPFDVLVVMRERTPLPGPILRRLPRLKLIVTAGPANAAIDMHVAKELGVTVCGTRMSPTATPELTWGLIIALTRNIASEHQRVRDGGWQQAIGMELGGRTIGLLGLGRIGARIAGYARAFEMNVLAWSENLTPERAAEHGATLVSRHDLFARSDIVSVHLVLSRRTRGLVGQPDLDRLGPEGYLVNTSRGPIVEEAALVHSLRQRVIAGAALDVFDAEPLPADHPLRSLDNVLLTPHIGYVSTQAYRLLYADAVADIAGWLAGRPTRVIEPPAAR